MSVYYHSTNNNSEKIGFKQAILNGIASNHGLYMMERSAIPKLSTEDIAGMAQMSYAEVAHAVLLPYVTPDISADDFMSLLKDAYDESAIPVELQSVADYTFILWLSKGPTYSFKDFAARFFGRVLNYFLGREGLLRTVVVATSGDTGGAVAHALLGLENVTNVVLFPENAISEQQRRQMTTLQNNIYAFAVNGDFDVCQEIAKAILSDRSFAAECFSDPDRLTSANSISLGRLLPQAVYPFFAYSRLGLNGEKFITSIPSGNFGDMMGTVIAKAMGLPIEKIVIGVNENREFPEFLKTGTYEIHPSVWSPSTAMIVSHPSNFARLVEFYHGHIYDEIDSRTRKVKRAGVMDKIPDIEGMRRDFFSVSVSNDDHYATIRRVYEKHGVILDPHGSVGWKALEEYRAQVGSALPSVVYETADPGKFPEDTEKAIGITPRIPSGIQAQQHLEERIYRIRSTPHIDETGTKRMSAEQYGEVAETIKKIFRTARTWHGKKQTSL